MNRGKGQAEVMSSDLKSAMSPKQLQLLTQLHNSRTTHSNALIRWLAWNMPYHAEHHRFTAIPFHALPKAHAFLKHHIAVQSPGYLNVHRELIRLLGR